MFIKRISGSSKEGFEYLVNCFIFNHSFLLKILTVFVCTCFTETERKPEPGKETFEIYKYINLIVERMSIMTPLEIPITRSLD